MKLEAALAVYLLALLQLVRNFAIVYSYLFSAAIIL